MHEVTLLINSCGSGSCIFRRRDRPADRTDDRIRLIGDKQDVEAAERLLSESKAESSQLGVERETLECALPAS